MREEKDKRKKIKEPRQRCRSFHFSLFSFRFRGQSMLEAIIAAGIIVTAVTSALTLVSAAVGAEKESESSLTAGGLAREGIEVARAIRDGNWLSGSAWDAGLEGPANDYGGMPVFDPVANSWSVDFSPDAVTDPRTAVYRFTSPSAPQETVGLFVQAAAQPAGTTPTIFRRALFLYPICSDDLDTPRSGGACDPAKKVGIRVLSQVTWLSGGRPRDLQMEERIFDWK
jgi:hypothetical protein